MTVEELREYLVPRYKDLLRFAAAILRRIGRPDLDARDMVQQSILQVLKWPGLPLLPAGEGNPLFFTVLRRVCTTAARKKAPAALLNEVAAPAVFDPTSVPLQDPDKLIRKVLAEVELSGKQRRAFRVYWAADFDRTRALGSLGIADRSEVHRQEQSREYDQPLHHARRRIAETVAPYRELLSSLDPERLYQIVGEVLCGELPERS